MGIKLEDIPTKGYERVVQVQESAVGLHAIISIHNTHRGPACGGIRLLPYESQAQALNDVLRLSRGMSYKSALANIGFGGGKSVILLDPTKKTPALFQAFGEAIEKLGGKYIGAKDMNTESADLMEVHKRTKHVLGIDGLAGSSGDPSPVTARGAYRALEAVVEFLNGNKEMKGVTMAVQGLGHVGYGLAEKFCKAGGKVFVTDINVKVVEKACAELGAEAVAQEAIYDIDCDIFSPNAVGATLNQKTIKRLNCRAVVGCANNQLETDEDGKRLHERGILYAPDYAVNAGGIINVFQEHEGYDRDKALKKADGIYDTVKEILDRSRKQGLAPFIIADKVAEERLGVH